MTATELRAHAAACLAIADVLEQTPAPRYVHPRVGLPDRVEWRHRDPSTMGVALLANDDAPGRVLLYAGSRGGGRADTYDHADVAITDVPAIVAFVRKHAVVQL